MYSTTKLIDIEMIVSEFSDLISGFHNPIETACLIFKKKKSLQK